MQRGLPLAGDFEGAGHGPHRFEALAGGLTARCIAFEHLQQFGRRAGLVLHRRIHVRLDKLHAGIVSQLAILVVLELLRQGHQRRRGSRVAGAIQDGQSLEVRDRYLILLIRRELPGQHLAAGGDDGFQHAFGVIEGLLLRIELRPLLPQALEELQLFFRRALRDGQVFLERLRFARRRILGARHSGPAEECDCGAIQVGDNGRRLIGHAIGSE